MADNAPLTKQDLLEIISGLLDKQKTLEFGGHLATRSAIKSEINEMRGLMATKADIAEVKGEISEMKSVMATKDDVESIGAQIKDLKDYVKYTLDHSLETDDALDKKVDRSEFEDLHNKAHAN